MEKRAGFRQDLSCTDQCATLHITVDQTSEWKAQLCVNFMPSTACTERVSGSSYDGIPLKLINLIVASYEVMACQVVHGGQVTRHFQVETGLRQRCHLSPFLFRLAVDRAMRKTTDQQRNGMRWTLWTWLDHLADTALPHPAADTRQDLSTSLLHRRLKY